MVIEEAAVGCGIVSITEAFTITVPPSGVNLRALQVRLRMTCDSLYLSASIRQSRNAVSTPPSFHSINSTPACLAYKVQRTTE